MAIPFPEDALPSLRRALSDREDLLERIPKSLHLTLRFLGNVPEGLVTAVADALAGASGPPSFELRLGPLGVFKRRGGTVLWAGIAPSGELAELKNKLDRALAPLPLASAAKRPGAFAPHVTLARLKPKGPPPPANPGGRKPEWAFTPGSFGLFSSLLRPEGALHSLLREYPLS